MEQQRSSVMVDVGEHGLKKHDIKTSTVVFMIFCLVAAGCFGIEEAITDSGPGLTIIMLCVMPFTSFWQAVTQRNSGISIDWKSLSSSLP